jgi:hypothetical protein
LPGKGRVMYEVSQEGGSTPVAMINLTVN